MTCHQSQSIVHGGIPDLVEALEVNRFQLRFQIFKCFLHQAYKVEAGLLIEAYYDNVKFIFSLLGGCVIGDEERKLLWLWDINKHFMMILYRLRFTFS